MKKMMFTAAILSSFVMCKKNEVSGANSESHQNADTVAVQKVPAEEEIMKGKADSSLIKIKNYEEKTSDVVAEKIDSVAEKLGNVSLKSAETKTDSLAKEKQNITINVAPPKIIKETKIVYPKKTSAVKSTSGSEMKKKGELEIGVSDLETAKKLLNEELYQHDALIKSQSTSSQNGNQKYAYLNVKVPLKKFDHLMENLGNLGELQRENSHIFEGNYRAETLCDLEITLYENTDNAVAAAQPTTFGGKSAAAISSGWNVLTSIFLFFLPLWPLFLVFFAVWYFLKKKKKISS